VSRELTERSLALISSGQIVEAGRLAVTAVEQAPDDWYAHYVLGMCLRFAQDYAKACASHSRANELSPGQPSVLLALAIARQLNGEYPEAIESLRLALEIDGDYVNAYNTLAMTQKLMGAFEKAAYNYDAGAKALARVIVKALRNAEDSPRLPHFDEMAELSTNYAMFGAMYLAANAAVDGISWPTGEMALRDERTQEFRGWYWQDHRTTDGKMTRLFLPNYFNTFYARLQADSQYANLMGNRSTVLRLMGNAQEAAEHLREAETFGRR